MGGKLARWLWTGRKERRGLGQDEAPRVGERAPATRPGTFSGEQDNHNNYLADCFACGCALILIGIPICPPFP